MRNRQCVLSLLILLAVALYTGQANAGTLKTHGIFSSNMVIQRDKPITIWGWAEPGQKVSVQFGEERAEATADSESVRWEGTLPARPANAAGQRLTVVSDDETIAMENIVIGDVWVMNGQSNMAFGLGATYRADMETAAAPLPLLRRVGISPNESYELQEDLPTDRVDGWTVCSPETAGGFSAIGYTFGSRLQRALQIPIGIIDNARGGASIESLVPRHKFDDHPLAARYADWVEKRRAEFDWDAASLVSAQRDGDRMMLTFDKNVMPDDMSTVPEGFSIADASGKFYLAHAACPLKKDAAVWNVANENFDTTTVYLWSRLVKEPVAARYAWATSPMGNLKVNGKPWLPLQSFRTDACDWPESEDPAESLVDRAKSREMNAEAAERLEYRKREEAKRAVEVFKQLELLGKEDPAIGQ